MLVTPYKAFKYSQSDVSMHLRSIRHECRKLIDLEENEYEDKIAYRTGFDFGVFVTTMPLLACRVINFSFLPVFRSINFLIMKFTDFAVNETVSLHLILVYLMKGL